MALNRLQQWTEDLKPVGWTGEQGIIAVCSLLHDYCQANESNLPHFHASCMYTALDNRIANWDAGSKSTKKYDKCVKKLVKAVLHEYEAYSDGYL